MKIKIGKVTTTHGLKGEIKIQDNLNDIQRKVIFQVGTNLIIDNKAYTILNHRIHKNLDMVILEDVKNIDIAIPLRGKKVYKEEQDIHLDNQNLLDEQLLSYTVLTSNQKKGKIKAIEQTGNNYKIFRLLIDKEEILLPYHQDFIVNINQETKTITLKL
mgnify:FL=1